mmetsp:Transcript_16783/g.25223  ORF Transcript_16783/g.25223 Transcript_16783/m.25223 type:complete len:279 (+) Transcript_16783:125-961(+)
MFCTRVFRTIYPLSLQARSLCDQPSNVQRLSKVIASSGLYSRRDAERMIIDGRVKVNFEPISSAAKKISPRDKIFIDDLELKVDSNYEKPRLWIVNKLRGELVASIDHVKKRPLMYTRLRRLMETEGDLKPINRLELNTEGLQLLTNNTLLAKLMENPNSNMKRKYRIRVYGKLTPSKLDGLKRGLRVKGVRYRPIIPHFERTTGVVSWLTVVCTENKTRFLKNCFEQLLLQITRAICTEFGPYSMPKDLPPGAYREVKLTPEIEKMLLAKLAEFRKK